MALQKRVAVAGSVGTCLHFTLVTIIDGKGALRETVDREALGIARRFDAGTRRVRAQHIVGSRARLCAETRKKDCGVMHD